MWGKVESRTGKKWRKGFMILLEGETGKDELRTKYFTNNRVE